MNFEQELLKKINIAEKFINELSPSGNDLYKIIFDAQNYSLSAGGKRIRPVLALAVCELLGGDCEDLKYAVVAIECIHTYSLIHDDLPCMDNDDLRRGKPSNHIVFGEALSLLAGDALLNFAFELLSNSKTKPQITVELIKTLSNASGANGMIGGQVLDISGTNDIEVLKVLHTLKTGALIKASAQLGAICAGADISDMKNISDYAENIGLAFQIKDDILDVIGDEAVLGKTIASDEKSDKYTFVTCYGIEESVKLMEICTQKAIDSLSVYGEKAEFLIELANYLTNRNR